ncbi:MAG: hypothetical protein K2Z81_25165 [Cyanobacteria bacterium]|nr:hypothetical protein [Cyanobacteriota bacterium]
MRIRNFVALMVSLSVTLPVMAQLTSAPGVSGAPQVSSPYVGSPYGGYNPYSRSAGFYTPNFTGVNYPGFGTPQLIGGGYYNVPSGRWSLPMWMAPSGYYYPWAPRPAGFTYAYPIPVLYVQQQDTAPSPALPPLTTVFTDLSKYLEKTHTEKKLNDGDYNNIKRRVTDLESKSRHLRIAAGGQMDSFDEAEIRREMDKIGSELSWRVNR